MSRSRVPDGLLAIALLVCVVAGCKQLESLGKPSTLKSTDGKFQITVPAGWREDSTLNDKAAIQAANPLKEVYVIVLTEAASDFSEDVTLDDYTDITLNSMKSNLGSAAVATQPVPVSINGNQGMQYEMQGETKKVKLGYVVTNVKSTDHFHQIVTWTLQSKLDENRKTLQDVAASFGPATPGAPTP